MYTPDKVIYFSETIFRGLENLSSLHKIGGGYQLKNFSLFSNMLLLCSVATRISMDPCTEIVGFLWIRVASSSRKKTNIFETFF
jgi:hypothetical protein